MELKKIILHQIIRENNEDSTLNLSDHLLEINETTIEFMEGLVKSYTLKSPTYGAFDKDITNNPFQTSVRVYFQNENFLEFSQKAMNTLKKAINKPNAKGGYVVFSHYKEKGEDFIVTAMLDNSIRFVVNNESLNIEKLLGLDIDKVARANRINWKQLKDRKEKYLSFIKGTRGVANYFAKDFIGCTDYTSGKENADEMQSAINNYMNMKKFVNDKKREIRKTLKEYTDKQIEKKEDIMINSISAYVDPENPTDFVGYVHENNLEVGDFHSTSKADFKGFTVKTLKGSGYKLEYHRGSEDIILDKENNQLIIKNIPESSFED